MSVHSILATIVLMIAMFAPLTLAVPLAVRSHPGWFSLCDRGPVEDVDGIKYVVNYDYPHSSEDYIHRIGRTARSENTGTSYAFFTPSNFKQARDLVNVLTEAKQVINPKLSEIAQKFGGFGGKSRWGYGNNGGYKGRENAGPKQFPKFGNMGGFKPNGFKKVY